MIVTIFGGSQPTPSDTAYEQAYKLGALLKMGILSALAGTSAQWKPPAWRCGRWACGGVTTRNRSWRPIKANQWVKEEWHTTPSDGLWLIRLQTIALPGGIGTLAEILMTWDHHSLFSNFNRPLIGRNGCVNADNIYQHATGIHRRSRSFILSFVDTVEKLQRRLRFAKIRLQGDPMTKRNFPPARKTILNGTTSSSSARN